MSAAGGQLREIDSPFPRLAPYRRRGTDWRASRDGFRPRFVGRGGGDLAHHGGGVLPLSVLEHHQRIADLEDIPRLAEAFRDMTGAGGRYFHDGLGGFHAHQRLVRDHVITHTGVPRDDLRLIEAFTEVGEAEVHHE